MKKTKLISKGILLYTTFLVFIVFISGVDSIANLGIDILLYSLLVIVGLILCCYKFINQEEAKKLIFYDKVNKILGDDSI